MDEPTDLPDGTEIELAVAEVDGELDRQEQRALNAVLVASAEDVEAGDFVTASEHLDRLRAKRR